MRQVFWSVPAMWSGETVVLFGGGPSFTLDQVHRCRDFLDGAGRRPRAIAINNSYLWAPWADILYFCDDRWYGWHRGRVEFQQFAGIKVTLENPGVIKTDPSILAVQNQGQTGLTTDRYAVMTGSNGGYQCINLAVHLGAAKIILLGFDMKPDANGRTHWHGGHPHKPDGPNVYRGSMLPKFQTLVEPLRERGVRVINATPGSALTVFEQMDLECALSA